MATDAMRTREVVGRRIVAVEQSRATPETVGPHRPIGHYEIAAFVLDDGTRIVFDVAEHEDGYGVTASAWRHGLKVG